MNPKQYHDPSTPGSSENGSGEITVDAGPDTSGLDNSAIGTPKVQQPDLNQSGEQQDLNDSRHDSDNVDAPIPEPFAEDQDENIVDRQLGIIGRSAG
ncbi:hypothetical protein [Fischerella sp. PCC 9605]|uniref:hypothetical protein n=1 Tax=Fischerella sp. PCC 9605 TaxID=1173024 RepID=UPI00047E69EC|nr:hypothetical protein [Fischerella sp. PCC 9605]